MSIIHDALKKIEGLHPGSSKDKIDNNPKFKLRVYGVYALVVCLGLFITNIFFKLLSKPSVDSNAPILSYDSPGQKPLLQAIPPIPAEDKDGPSAPSFILNGVFFSEEEGYALINNRIVKEGDKIEGATVVTVTLDEVKLDLEGSTIRLSK